MAAQIHSARSVQKARALSGLPNEIHRVAIWHPPAQTLDPRIDSLRPFAQNVRSLEPRVKENPRCTRGIRVRQGLQGEHEFEASGYILHEKIEKRLLGLGSPDIPNLRQGREGLKAHLFVFDELLQGREWLAGKRLSLADFVAAAHLSIIDYFGDMPWREFPACKTWYMKLKSRPCFRPLLNDRWPGLHPAGHYDDLDF